MFLNKADKMINSLQDIVNKRVRKKIDRPSVEEKRTEALERHQKKIGSSKTGLQLIHEWHENHLRRSVRLSQDVIREIINCRATDEISKNIIINSTEAYEYAARILKSRWPALESMVLNFLIRKDCSYRVETIYGSSIDLRMMGSNYIEAVFNKGEAWPEFEQYMQSLNFLNRPTDLSTTSAVSLPPVHMAPDNITKLVSCVIQNDQHRRLMAMRLYDSYLKTTLQIEDYIPQLCLFLKSSVDLYNAVDLTSDEFMSSLSLFLRAETRESSNLSLDCVRWVINALDGIVENICNVLDSKQPSKELDDAIREACINTFKMVTKHFKETDRIYDYSSFGYHELQTYNLIAHAGVWTELENAVQDDFDNLFIGYLLYTSSLSASRSEVLHRFSSAQEQKIVDWIQASVSRDTRAQQEHLPSWLERVINRYVSNVAKDRLIPLERVLISLNLTDSFDNYLGLLSDLKKKGWVLSK